ncbi:DUF1624 domain-containing protein [Candidatus Micrarchaeota archaeon]|nr:DUF1624 domain-containing protein [Candidatus Micrarchaeota archaeon]
MKKRFWEVDVTRGLAVALMIAYHFFFDLNYLGFIQIDFSTGFFLVFQRVIAFMFLSLVGVSLLLSKIRGVPLSKNLQRVLALAGIALLITLATSIYPGKGAIVFGIIHFIAVAVLIGYFFTELPAWLNLGLAALVVALGFWLSGLARPDTPLFLWLGLPPAGFYTLDYYPLIPWFGIVLLGIFMAQTMNPFTRIPSPRPAHALFDALDFLGKNALAVYLVHQPVLVGLLLLFRVIGLSP